MKKLIFVASILVLASTSCQTSKEDKKTSLDENKKMSNLYHKFNLEDVDMLLSDDFVGSYYFGDSIPHIWYKENHKNAIANTPVFNDSILIQVAEGDWVAERFIRIMGSEGTTFKAEGMQFKQIKNGKIISSWEVFSPIK